MPALTGRGLRGLLLPGHSGRHFSADAVAVIRCCAPDVSCGGVLEQVTNRRNAGCAAGAPSHAATPPRESAFFALELVQSISRLVVNNKESNSSP